jgi:dipeptidyl aminopeptidase/acylaminoacyl peptidase
MADRAYPPTFLGHGALDDGVPCIESIKMHERLDELGVTNELVILENYAHGFCKHIEDKDIQDTLARMIAFFDRVLKR